MKYLTLNEEALLIVIRNLGDSAYPVKIREEFIRVSGKNVAYGALYNSLDYLLKKKYATSRKGDPTPEKGGKSKVFFTITEEGRRALKRTREYQNSLWDELDNAAIGTK